MEICACGSEKPYPECCEPYITGTVHPSTAEELMRSRYTAYTKVVPDYILATVHPDKRDQHDEKSIRKWAEKSDWLGLEIIQTEEGQPEDQEGWVEFIARYMQKGSRINHHEIANFKKKDDTWYFYDGNAPVPKQVIRTTPKIGRNDPCSCGSGKKYKKCCGR